MMAKLQPGFANKLRKLSFITAVYSLAAPVVTFFVVREILDLGLSLTVALYVPLLALAAAWAIWFQQSILPRVTDADSLWLSQNNGIFGGSFYGILIGFATFWVWRYLALKYDLLTHKEILVSGFWIGMSITMFASGFLIRGLDHNASR